MANRIPPLAALYHLIELLTPLGMPDTVADCPVQMVAPVKVGIPGVELTVMEMEEEAEHGGAPTV